MGIINRAIKNISKRKIRALLVIVALSISLSIMVSIPAGLMANQKSTNSMAENLSSTITDTSESINQALNQIDVYMSSRYAGFGFNYGDTPPSPQSGDRIIGGNNGNNNDGNPGRYGGFGEGNIPGQFGGINDGATPMNQSLYMDIAEISGVAATVAELEVSQGSKNQTTSMMGQTFTTQITDYTIIGVELKSEFTSNSNYNSLPTNIVNGRNLQADDTGVVLLSQNNSAFFEAGIGDIITILDHEFAIIGIYQPTTALEELVLYMNLSDAQHITENAGYITTLKVYTTSSDSVDFVVAKIRELHSELTVTTGQQRLNQLETLQSTYSDVLENTQSSLAATQATAIQEIIVVVAATSLIVLFVMLYTVRERTKEIGTLKAIGFSNRAVMGQFLLEGLCLSTIAGIIGIVIAIFAAPTFSALLLPSVSSTLGMNAMVAGGTRVSMASVSISVELALFAFGASMLLGVVGTLYPAWRAAKIRPAEAMRYE
ncbi:MAG: FtsX-like permease family protein [Candidatus Bathyarchaeota archaeon]|nr:FtsX-like permease family protein [Candidatus Termiticorpusculum sp.]